MVISVGIISGRDLICSRKESLREILKDIVFIRTRFGDWVFCVMRKYSTNAI